MANMQRLEELVGVLKTNPEGHDQQYWARKTLFINANNLEDIKDVVKAIANGELV